MIEIFAIMKNKVLMLTLFSPRSLKLFKINRLLENLFKQLLYIFLFCSEDKSALSKLVESVETNYNNRFEEVILFDL